MRQACWWASLALIALAALGTAAIYPRLPDQLPIHWNLQGQVDGHGQKIWAAWVGLATPVLVWILLAVLPWLSPRRFEVEPFAATYAAVVLLVTTFLVAMHAVVLGGAFWPRLDVGRAILASVSLLIAALGPPMRSVRPNFWMGVRTPWTLADVNTWDDTHRMASWWFPAMGAVGFLTAAVFGWVWVPTATFVATGVVPVGYSWWCYRQRAASGGLA